MAWTRRRKPAPLPPGPPAPDTLPWGTVSWADDPAPEAEQWGTLAELLGGDREAVRRMRDGREVRGVLYLAHVEGPGAPRRVARLLWQVEGRWYGRRYGALAPALAAWDKWLRTTDPVTGKGDR